MKQALITAALWLAGTLVFLGLIGTGGMMLAWTALAVMLGLVAAAVFFSPKWSDDVP